MRNKANGRRPTWEQTFAKIVSDLFEDDSCPLALRGKDSQISDSPAQESIQSQD